MFASTHTGSGSVRVQSASAKTLEKQKRSNNFTTAEDEVLINEIERRSTVLNSKHDPRITNERKQREWKQVTDAVNRVSSRVRSVDQVQTRYKNIKTRVKGALGTKLNKSSANKTGGGESAEPLSSFEERMLGIIGETAVRGVTGGFDTSKIRTAFSATPQSAHQPNCTASTLMSGHSELSHGLETLEVVPFRHNPAPNTSTQAMVLSLGPVIGGLDGSRKLESPSDFVLVESLTTGYSHAFTPESLPDEEVNEHSTSHFGTQPSTPRRTLPSSSSSARKEPAQVRENSNTKLVRLQTELLSETKEGNRIARKRLQVKEERLTLLKEIHFMKRAKFVLEHPEIVIEP